jgi:hypothetical protein
VITLRRLQAAGRDYYQAVLARPGETIKSPLFLRREEAVRWVIRALNAQPTSASSLSKSKAGT